MPYRLTDPALDDLLGIARFLARHDPDAARHVVDHLGAAMHGLAEMPRLGHRREDLTDSPDLRFWTVHAYLIVYRSGSEPLEIVRILHGSRDAGRLLP